MEARIIVVIAGIALLIVVGVTWVLLRHRRPEVGGERSDIHALAPGDRDRFAERWRMTQASFVDDPARAVSDAEELVEQLLRARRYPVSDFDDRAADISVDHPRFVERFRTARDLTSARRGGAASTEDLRQATVLYGALVEDLLGTRVETRLPAAVRSGRPLSTR